jgi:hypothetical protein
MSLAMHWTAAAGAQEDWSQGVGVFGPGLARSPDVPPFDVLARTPGFFVDQRGVEAFDKLAFDEDLAGVGRIADQVFEDVAGEDDRLRPVVVGLVVAAGRPDAIPIQVVGQRPQAETTSGVELKDFLDGGCCRWVLNYAAVDPAVALRDGAQQLPVASQVPEIVPNAPGDLLSLLLSNDRLDLPRQPIDVAYEAVAIDDKDSALRHLGHKAKALEVVAVKAIGVVEGDSTDVSDWRRSDALHQGEVTRAPRSLFARAVSVFEVLEREA